MLVTLDMPSDWAAVACIGKAVDVQVFRVDGRVANGNVVFSDATLPLPSVVTQLAGARDGFCLVYRPSSGVVEAQACQKRRTFVCERPFEFTSSTSTSYVGP